MSINLSQVPALDPNQLAPVSLGNAINAMKQVGDPNWDANAAALQQVQTALNFYQNILKQVSDNTLSQVPVLAPDGQLIGWIGVNGPDAADFYLGYKTDAPLTITAITNATPPVVQTSTSHLYTTGDQVKITNDSVGTYNDNWVITVIDATHFSLNGGTASGAGAGGQSTRFFAGIWAKIAAFGGTTFADANIKIQADGSVIINGATITLDTNGVTTTIGNLSAGSAGVAGVQVKNDTPPSLNVQMTDKGYYIRASDQATYVVQLIAPADNGELLLRNIAGDKTVTLLASTPKMTVATTAGSGDSVVIGSTVVSLTHGTAIGQLAYSSLALVDASNVLQISADATIPSIIVGASGSAQSTVSGSSVSAVNAAATRSAVLSSAGTVSGTALGGTWSLSDNYLIHGVTVIDSSRNGFFLSVSVNGVASISSSGVATVVSLNVNGAASITSSGDVTVNSITLSSGNGSFSSGGVLTSGAGGGAQSVVNSSSVTSTNAGGSRSATLSSGGSVSGVALGSISWSLSSALIINGFTGMTSSGQLFSSNGFTGSQSFLTSLTPTSKTISVIAGIVTNIV